MTPMRGISVSNSGRNVLSILYSGANQPKGFKRPRPASSQIDNRLRTGTPKHDAGSDEGILRRFPGGVDMPRIELRQLRHIATDIVAIRIERAPLQHRVKDPEPWRGVSPAAGDPLPVAGIVRHVGIHQRVPEPGLALLPRDQQMLDQEARDNHAYTVV